MADAKTAPARRRDTARKSALDRLSRAERARVHEIMTELGIHKNDPDWVLLLEGGLIRDAIGDARQEFRDETATAVRRLRREIQDDARTRLWREVGKVAAAGVAAAAIVAGVAGWIGFIAGEASGRADIESSIGVIEHARPLTLDQERLVALIGRNLSAAETITDECRQTRENQGNGQTCTIEIWREPPEPN